MTRLRIDELVNAWIGDDCTPFQIALLGVFDASPFLRPDGTVDVPRILDELTARAGRIAALGRRVIWTHGSEGRPVWAADPSYDPAAHVETAELPAGADLPSWVANRILRPLDPDRPLWRAEVVDGLPGMRFAVLIVVHHILADGRAGVALAGSLLDPTPDTAAPAPPAVVAPPLPSHHELVRERRHEIRAALRRLQLPPAGSVARLRRGLRELRERMADVQAPVPVTSLPQRVGPGRRLAIVRQPLEDLRRTAHAFGVTVNDLLLAAVTGGLREQLTARGDPVAGLVVRTTVPASTGHRGQAMSMLVVDLPVGEPDPLRRLALISRVTAAGKTRLRTAGGDVTDVLRIPTSLARVVVQRGRRLGSRRITLSVTDVPGPPAPLWLAGARLHEAVPVAPLVPLVPLSVAALSYAGELAVSVNADASVTDVDVLADGIGRSFALLRDRALSNGRLPPLPAPLVGHGRDVVDCAIDIARSAEDVFAYCTDPRHETEWNPRLAAVQKLTDGPIGPGTRYRLRFRSGIGESILEYVASEPPRSWASTSSSTRLDVRFEGEVVPDAGRTRLRFRAQLQAHGALRLIAPVARRVLRRRWERDLTTIRSVLEGRGADLAMRPVRSMNGSKSRWAMIMGLNFVGPIAHFRWGRPT